MEENKVNSNEEVQQVEVVEEKEEKKPTLVSKIFAGLGMAILAFLIVVVGWLGIQKFALHDPVPSSAPAAPA